jgi:hypothetical protein
MMLLLEKEHLSFEQWLINLVLQNLLPEEETFRIIDLRQEYLELCWTEEELWQKWSESVNPASP